MQEINLSTTSTLTKKCHDYLRDCLVYWADSGYDRDNGGYFEAASLDGKPLKELDRRLRVQGRNIFSHAAGTIDGYGDFTQEAEGGFAYVMEHHQQETGFATLVNSRGEVINSGVFAYDHAFLLLATGWLYSLTGEGKYRQALEQVWSVFERLNNAHGGIHTSLPYPGQGEPMIQQNPHMHLFEALMDVHILTGEVVWLERAEKIYRLYCDYFYSSEDRLIREFFNEDYSPYKEKEWVDPGHHYEWTWLLNKYQRFSGEKVISIPEIFDYAEKQGLGKQGLAYEFFLPDGTLVKPTHRMWSQTEQIKARLTMYERTEISAYFNSAMESVETLFRVFCHPDLPGIWYDCLDDGGNRVSDKSPASTLYHLYVAFHEFIRVAKPLVEKS